MIIKHVKISAAFINIKELKKTDENYSKLILFTNYDKVKISRSRYRCLIDVYPMLQEKLL